MCKHDYRIYFETLKIGYCFDCYSILSDSLFTKEEQKEYRQVTMPPMFEEFSEKRWKELSPWPYLTYRLAKANMVYFGRIYNREYIILPVVEGKYKPIFYMARDIRKDCPKKYKYLGPHDGKKIYWHKGLEKDTNTYICDVYVCEGIADAIYMSQFGAAVALMGLSYNHSLDKELEGHRIILCLDNDFAGNIASILLYTELEKTLKDIVGIKFLLLDEGKDPVDYPYEEMLGEIRGRK